MRFHTRDDSGIKPAYHCPLDDAVAEVRKIAAATTPLDKLLCMKRACAHVNRAVQRNLDARGGNASHESPRAAENFRAMCTGAKGGKYTYAGIRFYRSIDMFIDQSGSHATGSIFIFVLVVCLPSLRPRAVPRSTDQGEPAHPHLPHVFALLAHRLPSRPFHNHQPSHELRRLHGRWLDGHAHACMGRRPCSAAQGIRAMHDHDHQTAGGRSARAVVGVARPDRMAGGGLWSLVRSLAGLHLAGTGRHARQTDPNQRQSSQRANRLTVHLGRNSYRPRR